LPATAFTAISKSTSSAIVFDGNALIVARGTSLLYRNGSQNWTALPKVSEGTILTFTTHPERPGRIVGGLDTGGIVLSVDGGKSWEVRGQGLPEAVVTAITTAATNPETLYAAIRGDGLWQSDDVGQSWTLVMDRPWLANAERDLTALSSVDLASGMGGIWLYAGTDTGVTRVPDCFCRWQDVQPGDAMDVLASRKAVPPKAPLPEGEPVNALVNAASRPATLYATLPSEIWHSQDAGVTWLKRSEVIATAIAIHPLRADGLVIVNDDGVLQSPDGGRTWTAIANI
jgi:photosystem II stability/assembly factor-like uncharacterized protein